MRKTPVFRTAAWHLHSPAHYFTGCGSPPCSWLRARLVEPRGHALGCLRDTIPKLTRSSPHRCLERHTVSRLPDDPSKATRRGKFADTAIGTVHIDISELRLAEGKPTMALAIDRVSKFTPVEFRDDAAKMNGADFLRGVVAAFPYANDRRS